MALPKKGLAGSYHQSDLASGQQDLLNLRDGYLFRNWQAGPDPRKQFPGLKCTWFPVITGDSQFQVETWAKHIPFDFGREHPTKPRPAGYSYYADDGYVGLGDYYTYDDPAEPGMKRRVRLAIFGNEVDWPAEDNGLGYAESSGVPPAMAAGIFYTMMQFWRYVHWVAPTCSQADFLTKGYYKNHVLVKDSVNGKYAPYLREFIATLWDYWKHVQAGSDLMKRNPPWPRLLHISFNLYPKGFASIPPSMQEMCEIKWYVDLVHEVLENTGPGLKSELRKHVWILEMNSRPAQTGPDFSKPAEWPGDKADWPGVQRFSKWLDDCEAHPYVDVYCGFIHTHPHYDHYAFVINDQLTANGQEFAKR